MTAATHSWVPIDLVTLGDAPPESPSIAGLFYPRNLHIVYGEPEAVKTWLLLVVCAEQLKDGQNVVWIDLEMSAHSIRGRLVDLGVTDSDLERFRYLRPSEPIGDKQVQADVAAMLATYKPSLVVVDAMAGALALHGFDPNSNADIEAFYTVILAPFRDTGAAVAVIDHVTKDRETRGRWPIGSQRKLGGADVGILVEMISAFSRGGTGLARLRTQKDRHGGLSRPTAAELELSSDEAGRVTWTIREATHGDAEHGDGWKPTIYMERVFSFLKQQPGPVSRNAIENGVNGKREWIRVAIDELKAEGSVIEEKGARGARLICLATSPQTTSPVTSPPCKERDEDEVVLSSLDGTSSSSSPGAKWGEDEVGDGGNDDIPF